MSVLERFRSVSDFKPLVNARDIRSMTMNWSLREKNIPKKKRILFLEDLKTITNGLVENVRLAEYTYPRNEETLNKRKEYISNAIEYCHKLWDEFTFIDDVQTFSNPLNLDKLEPILNRLYEENNMLKKWKDNSKILSDTEQKE